MIPKKDRQALEEARNALCDIDKTLREAQARAVEAYDRLSEVLN